MRAALVLVLLGGCSGPSAPTIPEGRPPLKQPPANAVGGFTLDVPDETVAAGTEAWPCWVVPLTVDGPSHMVGGAALTVGPGMHHGNIVARPHAPGFPYEMRQCTDAETSAGEQANDVLAGGAVLFGSSTQLNGKEWQTFPDGMAYRIGDGWEIVARMHYLNASDQPVDVAPRYQWFTVDESTVTQELFPFLWDYQDINIPPMAQASVRGDCTFPVGMKVVSVLPHMHALGRAFDAGFIGGPLDQQTWLSSPGYDPENGVIQIFDPAVDLGQGTGAWFQCTWQNTYDQTIVYGVGINEMCMLFGYGYPKMGTYSTFVKTSSGCVVLTQQ
jgi:hypothetical protein